MKAFIKAGFSRSTWYRALESELLELVRPGVARMYGSPRTRHQRIAAAVMAAGRGAMASHRSAAFLCGVSRPDDDPVDIILPERSRPLTDPTVQRPVLEHLPLGVRPRCVADRRPGG